MVEFNGLTIATSRDLPAGWLAAQQQADRLFGHEGGALWLVAGDGPPLRVRAATAVQAAARYSELVGLTPGHQGTPPSVSLLMAGKKAPARDWRHFEA